MTSAGTSCTCIRKHSIILLTDRKEKTPIKPGIFTTCMLNQGYKNDCITSHDYITSKHFPFYFVCLEIKYLSHNYSVDLAMPPSTPFKDPHLYNVIALLLSTPFLLFSGIICGPLRGSFAVLGSFAVQSGNNLRSGIICGLGIICGAVQTPF